jgi:hypothetical protein
MDGILEKMSSAQVLATIAIVVGGVVAITMILSITRYQLRALEDDTALKREQQQGELALRTKALEKCAANGVTNLDALLAPVPAPPDELSTELATRFGMLDLDPGDIGEALNAAMTADPARKQAIIAVMDNLFDHGAGHASILAAVRPLCPAPERSPASVEL